eukprot:5536991-Alexandrium_andersonii.AAC.1
MDRLGHPHGFAAALVRRQTHPSGRALELGLDIGLLSVSSLRRETRLSSESDCNTGCLEGGRRSNLEDGRVVILVDDTVALEDNAVLILPKG